MSKMNEIENIVKEIFPEIKEREIGKYSYLKYPKFLPMMKMKIKSYNLDGFGSIMIMNTSAMGLMKLSTLSFTPSSGTDVPFLLIDTMSMGKVRLAYVEFYNTTKDKLVFNNIEELEEKYKSIENYNEKDNWYVKERMKGSLIKTGTKKEEDILVDMIKDSLIRYRDSINNAKVNLNNIEELKKFAKRMVEEGNPSSNTLNKVLGEEEAKRFFNEIVMPVDR